MSSSNATGRPLISVVLPSYNDEPIIIPYYEAITAEMARHADRYDYELIYVDDGSVDGSQATLATLAKSDAKVTFVELFRNFGQQRALFAGLTKSRGEYVVTLDGDFQYPPEVIVQLAGALGEAYDMASGIRQNRKDNIVEIVTSFVGNAMIRKVMGINITDAGSVKAFSRHFIDKIVAVEHYYSDVYPTAFSMRPKLIEIDVVHQQRYTGASHWNLWKRLKVYLDIYVSYSDTHFEALFGLGASIAVGGVFFGMLSFLYKFFLRHQATYFELGSLMFLISFVGVAIIGWALTTSLIVKIYKQNAFAEPYMIRKITTQRPSLPPQNGANDSDPPKENFHV